MHGCFWHSHGCKRSRVPSSNIDYWERKLGGNVLRDRMNEARLIELGWRVFVVWECELREAPIRLSHFLGASRVASSHS